MKPSQLSQSHATPRPRVKRWATLALLTLALAACGSGGDDSSAARDTPSSGQSPSATPTPTSTPTPTPSPTPDPESLDVGLENPDGNVNDQGQSNDDTAGLNAAPLVAFWFLGAQDGQFLGVVNDNSFDSYSICNTFGSYGSSFSQTSIRNSFSPYGGSFGSYSAYNSLASYPPILYLYTTTDEIIPWYYITKNTFKMPYIDPDVLIAYFCS